MGTWGTGLLENDVAADVHANYLEAYNAGTDPGEILATVLRSHKDDLEDVGDAPYVWLALARAQWECGHLRPEVLSHAERVVRTGEAVRIWEEAGSIVQANVQSALEKLLARLRTPNPRPRKRRKPVLRKPVFAAGDCLSVRLSDGSYGAAIVVGCVPETQRPGCDTYGINLVGVLRYKSTEKPTSDVFERREWLRLHHGDWNGRLDLYNVTSFRFRANKARFEIVHRTEIRPDDPQSSDAYTGWDRIGELNVYLANIFPGT